LQRAEFWWEIAVGSNLREQYGIQRRRFEEANTFNLYADKSDLTEEQRIAQAKFVYQFLQAKEDADLLTAELIDRDDGEIDAFLAQSYEPAFQLLKETFGFGQEIEDYKHVFVDGAIIMAPLANDTEADQNTVFDPSTSFGEDDLKDDNFLVFMEGGNDTVIGDYGFDYIDGGENSDGSEDNDTLSYENLTTGVWTCRGLMPLL